MEEDLPFSDEDSIQDDYSMEDSSEMLVNESQESFREPVDPVDEIAEEVKEPERLKRGVRANRLN